MTPITLHIHGMSCGHCLNAVNRALQAVPGVEIRSVRIGRAEVTAPSPETAAALVAAVAQAGYQATAVAQG
jgi:copper chaperone CopZ